MNKRKISFAIIIALFVSFNALAQLGINVHYHSNDYKTWNEVIKDFDQNNSNEIFSNSYRFGIDYGFDMAMYRVSFFPGVFYKKGSTLQFSDDLAAYSFDIDQYGFSLLTQIYPLDLLSRKSSQCPSFHRGSEVFTKGLYILVAPELLLSSKTGSKYIYNIDPHIPFDATRIIFNFGIGGGIDIGITKNLSISPNLQYLFTIGEKWDGFSDTAFAKPSYNDATGVSQIAVGIRLGFWL